MLPQARRDLFSEQSHALKRELLGHVADVKLDQQVSHLGSFDEVPDTLIYGLGTADDDRLRSFKLVPVFYVTQKLAPRLIVFEVFFPSCRRDIRNSGAESKLPTFPAQVSLQTVLQEIPHAFFAFLSC